MILGHIIANIKQKITSLYTLYNSATDEKFIAKVQSLLQEHNFNEEKIKSIVASLKVNMQYLVFETNNDLKNYRAVYYSLYENLKDDIKTIEMPNSTINGNCILGSESEEKGRNSIIVIKHYGDIEAYNSMNASYPLIVIDSQLVGYLISRFNLIYKIHIRGNTYKVKSPEQFIHLLIKALNLKLYKHYYTSLINLSDLHMLSGVVTQYSMEDIIKYAKMHNVSLPAQFDYSTIVNTMKTLSFVISSLRLRERIECNIPKNRYSKIAYGCGITVYQLENMIGNMNAYLQNIKKVLDNNAKS